MTQGDKSTFGAIILAAGQGTRMKSARAKVLHELCGKPMLHYVVDAALEAGATEVVVVLGHGREEVEASLKAAFSNAVKTALQEKQQGTGHAVRSALPSVSTNTSRLLILCGDTPLLSAEALRVLVDADAQGAPLAMLTTVVPDPSGYGRVLRDKEGNVTAIREHKDASEQERSIREVNPGVYFASADFLRTAVSSLKAENAQREYYLTDIVEYSQSRGGARAIVAPDCDSLMGINDRAQLATAEGLLYERIADNHRKQGVTVRKGARIDASVKIGPNATIEHNVVLRGKTSIGSDARIDVGCVLTDVEVAPLAILKPYTIASGAMIGKAAQIGPFSHLRPDSQIEEEAHVGNFVETKKTVLRKRAKANHLAYLGDGEIGEGANVGAGTIFCNYDGFQKHKTTIGPGAFIGSDSQLVAPVTIGEGAYVATGTTVTEDVPPNALAIARVRQQNKEGYAERLKARLKGGKNS